MGEIYTTENIIRYLDGEMEGEELERFRQQLEVDPALQAELLELQAAIQAVKLGGSETKVQSIHREMMQELKSPAKTKVVGLRSWIPRMAAAAAMVIVLAAGWFYMKSSTDSIMEDHYIPYTVDVNRGMHSTSILEEAYNGKNYKEVLALAAEGGLNAGDSLITAISMMELHDYKKAADWLGSLQQNSRIGNDADYYLGFCYLGLGDRTKAREIFTSIHDNEKHVYHGVVTDAMMRKLRFRSN